MVQPCSAPPLPEFIETAYHMGVSRNGGPNQTPICYAPSYMDSQKKGARNFWKPPYLLGAVVIMLRTRTGTAVLTTTHILNLYLHLYLYPLLIWTPKKGP